MIDLATIGESLTGAVVVRALDAASLRHAAHAANIANVSTQGYRPLHVAFDEQLASARVALLDRHDDVARRALGSLHPVIEADGVEKPVRLDEETASIMQNALRYQALLTALSRNGAFVRAAIHEGRR